MKIGIDARGINWYNGTGIGTYTKNVLKNILKMDNENNYYIYWWGKFYNDYRYKNTKIIPVSKKHKTFFEDYYFPYDIRKKGIDIYHVPQNGIGLSNKICCKKIVTIHDLIPYTMPETVGKGYLLKFLKEVPEIIKMSDGIITVSEWSKKDILKFFPIDSNKVFVTPLAADDKYKPLDKEKCRFILNASYNIKKPFILYIGGFSSRKNVKSLITAFSNIYNKLDKEYNLVIVGAHKDNADYLSYISSNSNAASNIIFTGFVPEEHLPILYNGCDVFVYPSLYEGFGLPPLEAMNCATPVITSNTTSIPEVVGDGGLLINPYDTKSLMDSMEKLLNNENLRETLSKKALERASLFSWKSTAQKTLDVYKKIYSA